MKNKITVEDTLSWIAFILIFVIGILFLIFVHPVPGITALLLSLLCLPQLNDMLQKKFKVKVPLALKIILALGITWFTLGVSDLGEMLDQWLK